MNEDGTTIEVGAAGALEGTAGTEPSHDEIAELYKITGVKSPVPTNKVKGRPKAVYVRTEDDDKKGAGNSNPGSTKDDDNKNQPKDASNSNNDGNSRDKTDSKSSKDGKDAGKVQDESSDADKGVRDSKSGSKDVSEQGSKDGSEQGTERSEQEEEGKRPGKSNPEVEKRFQKLTEEKRVAEVRAQELEKKLQEKEQIFQQKKIAEEDPKYTIDDFRKVRDNKGEIIDLDSEAAELAWRRWKDGYDERSARRGAEVERITAEVERESELTREIMKKSTEAYDSLSALMNDYPELVSTSGKFDNDFAATALPIIQDSIEYLKGTEPGNSEDKLPVIIGLKINPKKILDALKKVNISKRSLPLNGINDNVDSRSEMNVSHNRSSDSNVNAANQLYKELGINKRF